VSDLTLFFSLFAYAAAKNAGLQGRAFGDVDRAWRIDPRSSPWDGWRTMAAAASLGEPMAVLVDGSTLITKARSRAAGHFLGSGADVWLTCDDDVYADSEVLSRLVASCRQTRGVVSAPCAVRDGTRLNVGLSARVPGTPSGLAPATHTGMGLVAMHADAILAASAGAPQVVKGGPPFPALFLERVHESAWIGEDWSFSMLCTDAGVPLHVLLNAPTRHAGRRAQLSSDLAVLVDPDTATTIGQ
jgi:hypothetical protein